MVDLMIGRYDRAMIGLQYGYDRVYIPLFFLIMSDCLSFALNISSSMINGRLLWSYRRIIEPCLFHLLTEAQVDLLHDRSQPFL